MSTGKLKAQYNRVRTSTALHTTSIWSNTIGLQQEQAGTNAAIEAQIYAPGGGGGGGRHAKRQRAQELIQAAGYTPAVTDFEGLKALARAQRVGTNTERRGACKLCGGLGHRTNQCKNFLDASGQGGEGAAADAPANMALIPDDDDDLLSSDLDSDSSGSDSSSSSDNEERRRKRRKHHSSSSKGEKKDKHKKHKKEKKQKKAAE